MTKAEQEPNSIRRRLIFYPLAILVSAAAGAWGVEGYNQALQEPTVARGVQIRKRGKQLLAEIQQSGIADPNDPRRHELEVLAKRRVETDRKIIEQQGLSLLIKTLALAIGPAASLALTAKFLGALTENLPETANIADKNTTT